MPREENMLGQHDPSIETIADLQRSITATLTYIMGRASVAELFGLQGYLSKLASQMTSPDVGNHRQPLASDAQLRETYHQAMLRHGLTSAGTPAPYRQEG
jgi:hypothetical protein